VADVKQYPVSLIVRAVDKLTGPLGEMTAKLKAFSTPFEKVGKGFGAFGKATGIPKLASAFSGAAGAVKNVGKETFDLGLRLVALGATGVFAFARIIHGAVEAGDELAKFADRVGVGIDLYASLRYSAQQNDVEQEQFNGAMSKFSKVLGEAKANGGPLLEILRKVSPTMAEQIKSVKTVEQGLSLMTTAFQRLPDPQRRAALSTAAFGREGIQVGEWMHIGSAAIQAQQVEYLKLAGSQELFARGSSDLDNDLRKTNAALQGLRAAALGPLLPVFGRLADRVTAFLVENRGRLAAWADDTAKSIQRWVDGGGLERLAVSLGKFADGVKQAWDFIGGFKGAAVGVGLYLGGPLLTAVAALVPAFAEVGIALASTPFGAFLLGAGAVAAAGLIVYKNWDDVALTFKTFFPEFTREVGQAADGVVVLVQWTQKLIDLKNELKASAEAAGGVRKDISDTFGGIGFNPAGLLGIGGPTVDFQAPARSQASRVQVVFKGAPPGTRVTTEDAPNQSVETSVGYQMSSHG
jgi:hypothetical protein